MLQHACFNKVLFFRPGVFSDIGSDIGLLPDHQPNLSRSPSTVSAQSLNHLPNALHLLSVPLSSQSLALLEHHKTTQRTFPTVSRSSSSCLAQECLTTSRTHLRLQPGRHFSSLTAWSHMGFDSSGPGYRCDRKIVEDSATRMGFRNLTLSFRRFSVSRSQLSSLLLVSCRSCLAGFGWLDGGGESRNGILTSSVSCRQ